MPEAAQSRRDQELTGVSHVPAREPQGLRPLDPLQVAWLGRSRPGGGRNVLKQDWNLTMEFAVHGKKIPKAE